MGDEEHEEEKEEGGKKRTIGQYEMGRVLGAGAFCKVRIGTHQETKETVAIKIVDKGHIENIKDLERVMREMHVLKNLKHPNIIKMHEAIEKGQRIYMVLDYAGGGELYDYIISKGAISEKEARVFFSQIMSGVDFFHRQKISHRDLKPENVLLVETNGALVCKVADFGLSNDMIIGEMLKTTCGTPAYAAPEMTLGQKYDGVLVDVWAIGGILFCMVAGHIPFRAESNPELFKKIQNASFTVPSHCSPEVADLIRKFMTVAPNKRIPISQAWQHPWLSSANRFAEFESDGPDSLESDLNKTNLTDSEAGGEASSTSQNFTQNDGSDEGGLPDALLELLPHHHLPLYFFEGAVQDSAGVSFLPITIDPDKPTPGGVKPSESSLTFGDTDQSSQPNGPANVTLFTLPKAERSLGVSLLTSPATPGGTFSPLAAVNTEATKVNTLDLGESAAAKGSPVARRGGALSASTTSTPATRSRAAPSPGPVPGKTGIVATAAKASAPRKSTDTTPEKAQSLDFMSAGSGKALDLGASKCVESKKDDKKATAEDERKARLAAASLCTVTNKEPRGILRELQRLFSDYKVLLRSATAMALKGEKNRVRFEVTITPISHVGDKELKEELYLVGSNRLAGDVVAFRDVCRRLLLKL